MNNFSKIKRTIALLIVFVTMLSLSCFAEGTTASAGGSKKAIDIAKGLGVIENVAENTVMTATDLENAYIAITGVKPETAFEKADYETISEMFVKLLGYEPKKTNSNSYSSVLSSIGGLKGVKLSGNCTFKEFSEILKNALDIYVMDVSINTKGNSYVISNETFLNRYFYASKYTVKIVDASQSTQYVKATVKAVSDKKNLASFSVNSNVSLSAENTSLLVNYKGIDVIALVDAEGTILYWYPKTDDGILYTYISAVNGSENAIRSYYGKYISNITLGDDKYNLASGCEITYNEKNANNSSNRYVGNFAKAVLADGKVTKLDVYTLTEGGFFNKVDKNALFITLGMGQTKKIKDIDLFENVSVIVDGVPTTLNALTANTIVDYYKSENELLLVGSSYIISDYMQSLSNKYIVLSDSEYSLSKTYNVYYSNIDGEFIGTSDGFQLLNSYCDVYFDYKGEVRYVKLNTRLSGEIKTEFYGLLTGIINAKGDAFGNNGYTLKFYKLDDGKCEETVLNTKDDIVLPDTIENMKSTLNNRDTMEKNIYIMKTNKDGLIFSIKKAESEKEIFFTQNNDHVSMGATSFSATGTDDSLFSTWQVDGTDVYAITIVDGETKAVSMFNTWPGGIRYGRMTACYVVPEMATKADIVLCWSTKYDDGILYSYGASQGIVTDVTKAYDENRGEIVNRYNIMKTDGTTLTLDAPDGTEFDILKKGLLFSFKGEVFYSEYPIYLGPIDASFGRDINGTTSETKMLKVDILDKSNYDNALDYADYIDTQKANGVSNKDLDVNTSKTQLYKDTIYMYGTNRIWFGPKNLYGVNTLSNLPVFKMDLDNGSFKIVDDSELSAGQEIYFYFNGSRQVDFAFILE